MIERIIRGRGANSFDAAYFIGSRFRVSFVVNIIHRI
jgi:hypothetical protein